jgi:L-ascorbate metabolism protein UlaG (beta-lactamase superfamily)
MRIRLIRNAALVLDYGGTRFLIDPDLAPRHARESFTGRSRNPMVDLPIPAGDVGADVEVIVVSHLHDDHFDRTEPLAHALPLLCQPGDEEEIRSQGFTAVEVVTEATAAGRVAIRRTGGRHGLGEVGGWMGEVSGFVFEAEGEPKLYWAGDTVLCDEVRDVLSRERPDVVVTHSCGASWPDSTGQPVLIVMDAAQTIECCGLATGVVVATHMEALDHATVSRAELRQAAETAGVAGDRLQIPLDGETLEFT